MEVAEQLNSLMGQYRLVEDALKADPTNAELQLAKKELLELVTELDDMLKASATAAGAGVPHTTTTHNPGAQQFIETLPIHIGTKVEAKYAADGRWYPAIINAHTETGLYSVTYTGYGNKEDVKPEDVREIVELPPAEPKKRKVENKIQAIPESLKILPTDSEEVKAKKKRKIKKIKSKNRSVGLETERNTKKQTWQQFSGKKMTRKTGFFTTAKKDSIFKTPDTLTGKVGVTGSGGYMTPYSNPLDAARPKKKLKKAPGDLLDKTA